MSVNACRNGLKAIFDSLDGKRKQLNLSIY